MLFELLRKGVQRKPATPPVAESAQCSARGTEHYRRGDFTLALEAYRRALALDQGDADVCYGIAMCSRALGDRAGMQAALDAAFAADARHLRSHQLLSDVTLPGRDYRHRIAQIHDHLRPDAYLEIGVARGATIELARPETMAIGVDPEPAIDRPLGPNVRIHACRSDDFFARNDLGAIFGNRSLDLAFIDGMHNFEYSLRDFAGVEKLAGRGASVLMHDTYPLDRVTSARERSTVFWSGDIWRAVLALKKYRPDLSIHTIAAAPTGLTLIRGLDPSSRVLAERMGSIVEEFARTDYCVLDGRKSDLLSVIPNDWERIRALLDA